MDMEAFAKLRIAPPSGEGTPRFCDVEVSSDEGKTWRPLCKQGVGIVQGVGRQPYMLIKIPYFPGINELSDAQLDAFAGG